jgi:hypothetical protein
MAERKAKISKHTVDMEVSATDIARAGAAVEFKVHGESGLLGTIQIGKGTFGWKAANKQKFRRISWTAFASKLNDGI